MCPDTPQESASLPSDEGTPSGIEQRQDGVDATQLPAATGTPVLSPAECAQQLAALFPALFGKRARPLKLRIQADIQARAPGVFTKAVLSAFLRRYTGSTSYLQSLAHSTERFDLDGNPAGELSEEHREQARQEVQRRRALREERFAQEREAARAAQEKEREAQRADEEGRRERARLLRDFETTRLTRANFCALKGIAEPELEGRLAIARQEAAQGAARRSAEVGDAPRRERDLRDGGGTGGGHSDRLDRHPGGPGRSDRRAGPAGRGERRDAARPGPRGERTERRDRPGPSRGAQDRRPGQRPPAPLAGTGTSSEPPQDSTAVAGPEEIVGNQGARS
ncbi:MAG: prop effector ProQ [Burkholderiales bacterium]|jgi:ProP effector|nr:prop effector ProQ [Burkholderiales bacterium]MBP7522362.1 prop effector ProQ [Leptothrix sp. (in: b-proteobacteria)]